MARHHPSRLPGTGFCNFGWRSKYSQLCLFPAYGHFCRGKHQELVSKLPGMGVLPSECHLPLTAQAEFHSSLCACGVTKELRSRQLGYLCILLLESSRCCLQTHGMCICVHRHVDPHGLKVCPYLGGPRRDSGWLWPNTPAHGASPQERLGITWAFSSASLKNAPKALPSVLAQNREKESNPLGGREMWPFQGFLSFLCCDPCTFK